MKTASRSGALPNIEAVYTAVTGRGPETFGRRTGAEVLVSCPSPSHPDRHPSCSLNATKGAFYCHACGAKGGILDLPVVGGVAGDRVDSFVFIETRRVK